MVRLDLIPVMVRESTEMLVNASALYLFRWPAGDSINTRFFSCQQLWHRIANSLVSQSVFVEPTCRNAASVWYPVGLPCITLVSCCRGIRNFNQALLSSSDIISPKTNSEHVFFESRPPRLLSFHRVHPCALVPNQLGACKQLLRIK